MCYLPEQVATTTAEVDLRAALVTGLLLATWAALADAWLALAATQAVLSLGAWVALATEPPLMTRATDTATAMIAFFISSPIDC